MPTLSEFKQSYYEFTGLTSSSCRQLALAGIAIIWIFKTGAASGISIPSELLYPAIFFVISLAADLLQYFVASAIWGTFHRFKEKQHERLALPPEFDVKAPYYFPWPQLLLFNVKVTCVLFGYTKLIIFMFNTISFS